MKEFIVVSAHINKLLGYFCQYYNHETLAETDRLQVMGHSNRLHLKLLEEGDLAAYDKHLKLAKSVYRIMRLKINHNQIVEDILYCGSSDLSWEETSQTLSDLYQIDLQSKEIYAFYYLHEINNHYYIDSPIPMHTMVNS